MEMSTQGYTDNAVKEIDRVSGIIRLPGWISQSALEIDV